MFTWRKSLILGAFFVAVGAGYFLLQSVSVEFFDRTGVTMLILLGVSMVFVFAVLLHGSREL